MAHRTALPLFVGPMTFGAVVALAATTWAAKPAAISDAEPLVQSALEAGLAGDATRRAELLEEAIAADPQYAPARWQAGQVKFQGSWKSTAEVSQLVAADARWEQYDALRQSLADTPFNHQELARWCYRQGLENEERYHWSRVISVDPAHQLARDRLGLREYRGGLYTHEQVAEFQQSLAEAKANFEKFKPILHAVCRRVTKPDLADHAAALEELRRIDDPAAIDALQYVVAREGRKASDELALEMNLAVVTAIANIPDHDATMRLLNYSVFSDSPEVRALAAQSLKPREVTDYVPQLMAALTAPIEAEINTFSSPDGIMGYSAKLSQAGPLADVVATQYRDFIPVRVRSFAPGSEPESNNLLFNRAVAAGRIATRTPELAQEVAQTRQQVALANAQGEARNQRIREVLFNSIGLNLGNDPKTYWQAWADYNELYSDDHPRFETSSYDTQYVLTCSCFMAGTPVWTQSGTKAINHIVPGDLVLSQDPLSGELAYRAVTGTTIRPPSRMVQLRAGAGDVVATLGHRFWVDGRGWVMAKFLEPAAALHALDGAVSVQATEVLDESEGLEAYNLVVDGFHTYFVGESKLLVHDNSCPRPTTAPMPGATPLKSSAGTLAGN